MKQVVIIGESPLKNAIKEQYLTLGAEHITESQDGIMDSSDINNADEFVIFSNASIHNAIKADNDAIATLTHLSGLYSNKEGLRPTVHLMLQSQTALWMLLMMDLPTEVNDKFDVFPSTKEDVWAKNLLVQLPGIKNTHYPTLDRESITANSNSHVHVVISGFNSQAEAIAIHTALVAHYPNYRSEDHLPLRTRITIIEDGIIKKCDTFVAKYQHLFDNSFYRIINMREESVKFHHPMYQGQRADFVDVEWDFVDASVSHPSVYERIAKWSNDENQQLTIFVCHDDDEQNLSESMSLPRTVYEKEIPVMVQQSQTGLSEAMSRSFTYKSIRPFGMNDCGYDIKLPLVQLAKYLKYFYDCSYGNIGVPTELPQDEVAKAWQEEKSIKMRYSSIYNVMTIATKMRSLGHDTEDADTFYALTQDEIESMSETEHNRWSAERLIQGVRPCTDEELKEIRTDVKVLKKAYKKRDIHFDLRAYSELEEDGTGKNAQVYDYDLTACIPLIVKSFYEDNNHGE